MAFYETPWWDLLTGIGMFAWGVFCISDFYRVRSLPGSYTRYRAATQQWATAYPALGGVFLQLLANTARGDGIVLNLIIMAFWVYLYQDLRRSGDDNWFHRTGTRLRRWAHRRLSALSPLPAGAGA